jgi:hypothetical protein
MSILEMTPWISLFSWHFILTPMSFPDSISQI